MPSRTRIAVFHDDSEVARNVAALAAESNLEPIYPASATALETVLHDPLIAAVVLDLVGPRSGGFELLERVANAPSHPQVVVITALDSKTIDSLRRLGTTTGLKLQVFQKHGDEKSLRNFVASLERPEVGFGPQHLEHAIASQLLHVEYQPKVPLVAGSEEYAVEALCRLKHPEFGDIYPDQFIPMAEKHGLIAKLTDFVVCESFRALCIWNDSGIRVGLALNVSPELVKTAEWSELLIRRCAEFKIEPDRITLEVTESSSGATLEVALQVLTRLRLKGFTLSIDDFGTGFSSLATLYKLPFSELKIDKSFTFDLQKSAEARALIETTIGMARRLGLNVVAEGVETEGVFYELRAMGCQHAQGYFISKSIAADKVPQFFSDWSVRMKSQPLHEGRGLPKIAIIQSLLCDILNEDADETDATLVMNDLCNTIEIDENSPRELARNIPTLVLQGKSTAALARCHAIVQRLDGGPQRAAIRDKVLQLRHLLEQELIVTDDLEISTPDGSVRLLPRRAALIGRPSSTKAVDISVACRWFSRGDKNLRLFADGPNWFVEDLGSTNGSSIGDQSLLPGKPYTLPLGETLIEIGKRTGGPAPVAIRLRRPAASPQAIVMSLEADEARLNSTEESLWPTWRADLRTRWILFDGNISLGTSVDCAVRLDDSGAENAAEISFEDGFWITPSQETPLTIDDTSFAERVPLPVKADVTVGGACLRVENLQSASPAAAPIAAPLRAKSS